MKKINSLSIFFPAYNDARILPSLVEKAYAAGKNLAHTCEIIIVDDGSSDNTQEIVEKLKRKYAMLRCIKHEKNFGYGAALRTGFEASNYAWIFYTDGDGQYDPSEIKLLIEALTENTDVVNGWKRTRSDPPIRRALGAFYNSVLHAIYNIPIRDVDCDFRLIRKSFLDKITLTSTSGVICLELIMKLKKAGAGFREVGVSHYKRQYGSSQFFNARNLLKMLYDNIVFYIHNRNL